MSAIENPEIVIRHFELNLLDLVGFKPQFFACVECGKKIIERDQFLSGELGGVVCPACALRVSAAFVKPVSARTLKYLRHIQRSEIQDLISIQIPLEISEDLEKSSHYYLTHTLERHLNSPEFIRQIAKGSHNRD
jgi:DNA repair protein RecO (recombination protein O)